MRCCGCRPDLDDPLPIDVRARARVPVARAALERGALSAGRDAHRRLNAYQTPAQRRLVFEEFFRFQVGLLLRKRESEAERKVLVTHVDDRIRDALARRAAVSPHAGQRRR